MNDAAKYASEMSFFDDATVCLTPAAIALYDAGMTQKAAARPPARRPANKYVVIKQLSDSLVHSRKGLSPPIHQEMRLASILLLQIVAESSMPGGTIDRWTPQKAS